MPSKTVFHAMHKWNVDERKILQPEVLKYEIQMADSSYAEVIDILNKTCCISDDLRVSGFRESRYH